MMVRSALVLIFLGLLTATTSDLRAQLGGQQLGLQNPIPLPVMGTPTLTVNGNTMTVNGNTMVR
jgi:hypothetical protein